MFIRFDDWKSGPLPKLKKVIVREVPSAGNRRALLERGDADISFDLPPKDFAEIATARILSRKMSVCRAHDGERTDA